MDLNRRVCYGICLAVLLLGHNAFASLLSGNNETNGSNLDCTNYFEELMLCQLELQNCSEYSLTLQSRDGKKSCTLQQCGTEQCCCSFNVILVFGETHTVKVWNDGKIMESKVIRVTESFKPKTPTIVSVTESNGNFEVNWMSNMKGFINDELIAEVTYYKKGETTKISKFLKPATVNKLYYHEINGHQLDPSSTYVVSVKSFSTLNDKCSDSSAEWEFKTPSSTRFPLFAIVVILSITAVIFSIAVYGCCAKLKTKLWDSVIKPPILTIYPSKQEVLKPESPPPSVWSPLFQITANWG